MYALQVPKGPDVRALRIRADPVDEFVDEA
jgi:hypothetical protein